MLFGALVSWWCPLFFGLGLTCLLAWGFSVVLVTAGKNPWRLSLYHTFSRRGACLCDDKQPGAGTVLDQVRDSQPHRRLTHCYFRLPFFRETRLF
jgi:hypothetical protein